jgi:pyruvate formate lyase activating enzyme
MLLKGFVMSTTTWRETSVQARLEEQLANGVVRCHLSPRNCTMREGQHGFCGVRGNRNGRLVSFNYGKSVHLTQETIETEAVNHYAPGAPIVSMGNVGCMLNCVYCHNWKTSQAKHVEDKDVYYYTPEEVVETALRHNVGVLSWTYNDPVVWHEFVRDTAKLGQQAGLINLYKSAFFITPEAIDELLPYMDIFSISVKSIDPEYYRQYTSGWLQPVLDGVKQVFRAGKHVELSTLMITDISDNEDTARKVADWVLTNLGSAVPVHFVRFHPDYKLRDTIRTPVDRLERAREIALEMGLEHVYLGNVYDTKWSNTFCRGCDQLLVSRYGLNANLVGLDSLGHCTKCGRDAHFRFLASGASKSANGKSSAAPSPEHEVREFFWHGDIRSLHAQARNTSSFSESVFSRRILQNGMSDWTEVKLVPGESYRFIVAKAYKDEVGCAIACPPTIASNLHEVFDRAHFPTVALEEARSTTDVSPLPIYPGKQMPVRGEGSGAGLIATAV